MLVREEGSPDKAGLMHMWSSCQANLRSQKFGSTHATQRLAPSGRLSRGFVCLLRRHLPSTICVVSRSFAAAPQNTHCIPRPPSMLIDRHALQQTTTPPLCTASHPGTALLVPTPNSAATVLAPAALKSACTRLRSRQSHALLRA